MKNVTFSKLFVLSFIGLIIGACVIPLIASLINTIRETFFILQNYFFYQVHINIYLYLLNQILPFILIIWLIFEFAFNPGLFKIKFSRPFRNFILSNILKRKINSLDVNRKNLEDEIQKSENERNESYYNQKISININFPENIYTSDSYLEENRYQDKFKPIFNLKFIHDNINTIFSSIFSFFSTFSLSTFPGFFYSILMGGK